MSYIPDAYDQWARHDAEQEAMLGKLPRCSECDERIQDEYCFEINGETICEHCLHENHRHPVTDFM